MAFSSHVSRIQSALRHVAGLVGSRALWHVLRAERRSPGGERRLFQLVSLGSACVEVFADKNHRGDGQHSRFVCRFVYRRIARLDRCPGVGTSETRPGAALPGVGTLHRACLPVMPSSPPPRHA